MVIITWRPHIQGKLNRYCTVGDLKIFEFQGLTEEQVDLYVEMFFKHEDHILNISKAKFSSNIPVIHVPQYLNTLCCIAILFNGQEISNSAELHCWIVFLLLKQHLEKFAASRLKPQEIYREFSQPMVALSKVCFDLLRKNKIVFKGNVKVLLGDVGQDKEFVESLFVDVSDNITEKYQFKHLSLRKFFSAFTYAKKTGKIS